MGPISSSEHPVKETLSSPTKKERRPARHAEESMMPDPQIAHLNFDRKELEAQYVCRTLEDADWDSLLNMAEQHLMNSLAFTPDEDFVEILADFYPDLLEEENI